MRCIADTRNSNKEIRLADLPQMLHAHTWQYFSLPFLSLSLSSLLSLAHPTQAENNHPRGSPSLSAQVLKDLEPRVNEVFAQTKTWKAHQEREMKLWDKLHVAVKKNVLAQYQHKVGFCPDAAETTPTW